MIGIAWRVLRRQPGTILGGLIMMTVGAALISAFMIVQHSIEQTRAPVERFAAAGVVAAGTTGNQGLFTAAMIRRIEAVPGVAQAIPELTIPVQVLSGDGTPVLDQATVAQFGHSWASAQLTPLELIAGREPLTSDEVALDHRLAQHVNAGPGDAVPLEVGGLVYRFRVSGIASAPPSAFEYQHALFFSRQRASELAGRGPDRCDAVGVLLGPGANAAQVGSDIDRVVRQTLAGDVVVPSGTPSFRVAWGQDRGELEGAMPDHRASAAAMTMLVWIVSFMAVAVIAGALITSVRRRSAQFALLRALGASPGQIRILCQAEALLSSLLAATIGGLLGAPMAWALIETFRAVGTVTPVLTLHHGLHPMLISGLITLVVAQIAAWWTGRTALGIRPGDALAGRAQQSARHRRRAWVWNLSGALLLLAAGALQAAGMAGLVPDSLRGSYGMLASGLVILGIGFLGSPVIHLVVKLVRRPVACVWPVGGYLGAANVGFHYRRYAGVAAPLAVGVALAGWALSGLPLFARANAAQVADRFAGSYVVRTPIVRDAHTGLSLPAYEALQGVPGVEGTAAIRQTWLFAGPGHDDKPDSLTYATVVSGRSAQLLHLGTTQGDLARVDDGGIALGTHYAKRQGVQVGDHVHVRVSGASRASSLEVVALFDQDHNGQEAAVVSEQALEGDAGRRWYDYVLVNATAQVTSDRLREALSPGAPVVEDEADFLDSYVDDRVNAIDNLGTLAVVLVGMFLILSAVNALALSAADRSEELSAIRRLNATPAQVRAMVSWEMGLTVVPAWLLGAAATLWMAAAMAVGDLRTALWAFPVAPLVLLGVAGVCLAVSGSLTATAAVQRTTATGDVR